MACPASGGNHNRRPQPEIRGPADPAGEINPIPEVEGEDFIEGGLLSWRLAGFRIHCARMYRSTRIVIHEMILVVLRILTLASKLVIFLGVAGIVLPHFDDVGKFRLAVKLLQLNHKMDTLVESIIPTAVGGYSLTPGLVILSGFLLKVLLNYAANREMARIYGLSRLSEKKADPRIKPRKASRGIAGGLSRAFWGYFIYRRSRLVRLQNKIARLRVELNKFGRDLVFLSIDVVDSTQMKKAGDPSLIAVHFKRYNDHIHQILKENHMLKASWTPDGVMACFESFPDAFGAAKKVILSLNAFNLEQNQFRHEFRVRCGINGGFVLFDEALKMEEIASHAIDVTAHVQRAAPPGTLYVTSHTIDPKDMLSLLAPTPDRIDGCELFMWGGSGLFNDKTT